LLGGRSSGQILTGGIATGEDLTFKNNTVDNLSITLSELISRSKETAYACFSLPEEVLNTTTYFYTGVKNGIDDTLKSGHSSGLSAKDQCSPHVCKTSGKVIEAVLGLKGAGINDSAVTYPAYVKTELWKVGFDDEGTKLGDIDIPLTQGVGTMTNADVNESGIVLDLSASNINVSKGDMLGLKFVNGSGVSEIAFILNCFINLKIKEQ
jgi:hypothetical protein